MPILHIEHRISDLPTWLTAFRGFAPARAAAGVTHTAIYHPDDDPQYVVVELAFESAACADDFRTFLIERVWSSPDASPALVGAPTARVLVEVTD